MKLYNSFGLLESILTGVFILCYIFYIIRVVKISRAYDVSVGALVTKVVIRTLYFSLFIIALLGPTFGDSKREVKSIGKDIFIAIDLSQSMNAIDIAPSRLRKIKFEMKNIIDAFSSDRIGIIMFSNEAFLQSPLTFDKNALDLFVETLSTNLVPNSGTDFGPPLEMALDKLGSEKVSFTQPKSKIIVLISDGEDFGEKTDEIAEKVQNAGIKLFTLGIGTEKGSKIPGRGGFKQDLVGRDVLTKLSPNSLKRLAAQTDGKYFEINDNRNDVNRLINTIDQIEGELRDAKTLDVGNNKYYIFLWVALGLICLDLLLTMKIIKIA